MKTFITADFEDIKAICKFNNKEILYRGQFTDCEDKCEADNCILARRIMHYEEHK